MASQKEMEKKMKAYLKAGKGAYRGKRRAKKKLKKMVENDIITVLAKRATNHPSWYTKLGGELIGLNYGAIDQLAQRNDLIKGNDGEAINVATTTDVIVYVAITATDDDTIRVAAQKIVNELRLVSGANTIYTTDDMIDYILNIRSIWVALTEVRRAVRCLNASDPYDIDAWRKYLAMALGDVDNGTAVGLSEQFRQQAANIVNWLNTIVKSVRFMMPSNFALFERTQWMFTNIFVDGTGDKFGTKMFLARDMPYYTHASGSSSHTATTYKLFDPTKTPGDIMTAVQTMVSSFTTKPENIAIAGDLMKAYGMASFFDPGSIGYTEKPCFLYDERALEQIANADVILDFRMGALYRYDPDASLPPLAMTYTGTAISKTQYCSSTAVLETKFVNTEDNQIEPGETLSLTRLKASVEVEYNPSSNLLNVGVRDNGTEVVIDYVYVVGFKTNNGHSVLNPVSFGVHFRNTDPYQYSLWFSLWSMDDYGPMALLYNPNATDKPGSGNQWNAYPVFDFSNWALMSRTEQRQFHKTAVLSLLTPSASVIQQAVAVLH